MRNLKKLLAVVVAICILATFTIPAFAAGSFTYEAQAKSLYDMKLFQGISSTEFVADLGSQLSREQGITLLVRMFGKEADALAITDADTVLANYTDAKNVSIWAKKYVAYAVKTGMVVGVTTTTLDARGNLFGNAFATMILKNMGYTQTAADYATASAKLQTKGATLTVDQAAAFAAKALIRDDSVGMMFSSLLAKDSADKTLIENLVAGGVVTAAAAEAAGLYTAVPAIPAVVSATADNLKVVKIVFNKAIDSTYVTTTTIAATGLASVTLGSDNKTVYAIMTAVQAQSSSVDFTINGVKDLAGTAVAKTVKSVSFVDTTVPVITGAIAENAKTIKIYASEPINYTIPSFQVLNNIKIDGIAVIGKATSDLTTNVVTIELSSILKAGTHTIAISDLTDFATYKAVAANFNLDVASDTTAPVIVSAKVNNINEIEVTFNENVDLAGSFTVNGTTVVATQQTDKSKFKLTLGTALNIGAIVEITIGYQNQTDVIGNKVSTAATYLFKVADDTALPTVVATIASDNDITLTFSKSMLTTAGTIKVYDTTNSALLKTIAVVPALFTADTNNTVIEISAATAVLGNVDPINVKVNITGMKDATVRANALAEQNLVLKANDTKKPTVTATYLALAGSTAAADTVTFYFSEAMDAATLNNLSNYILEGTSSLAAYADAAVSSIATDAKSITITVPGIFANAGAKFTVYALKDLAGNMSTTATGISKLTTTAMNVASVTATAGNTVAVVFDTTIASFDPSVFVVNKAGVADTAVINYALDGKTATLTLSKDLGTVFTGYTLAYNNYALATNVYGTALTTASAWALTDKVGPIATVAAATSAGAISVTFSEDSDVVTTDALLSDVIVRDADGALVSVTTSQVVYLNNGVTSTAASFDEIVITGLDEATAYTVEIIPRNINDASVANNKVAALAKTAVTTN